MNKKDYLAIIVLQVLLAFFSISGIFSKMAANAKFLSFEFCCYYFVIIVILGLYAVVWQQIIKQMPLTVAYANRAVIVVWGIIWGILFFNESITIGQLIGAAVIIAGIILYSMDTEETRE